MSRYPTFPLALLLLFTGCSDDDAGPETVHVDAGCVAPLDEFAIEVDAPDTFENPDSSSSVMGVTKINDVTYMAPGFGNTIMVVTDEGNVIIDTSIALTAQRHYDALRAVDDGPVKYIILTHGHEDHVGGVDLWKEDGTQVIAQAQHEEFMHYSSRLSGVLGHHNQAQFSGLLGLGGAPRYAAPDAEVDNHAGKVLATTVFEDDMEFELGGLRFQLVSTPGETYDHLTVWMPQYKVAFTGDNFYGPFPNIYTLRGTKPRWALDYVESIDRVLGWEPQIVVPSHEEPVYGDDIVERMGNYRDAILYVHDATVQGMNAGIDIFELANSIELPPELAVPETYGDIGWTVRGIADGYMGWFDGRVANMFSTSPRAVQPALVEMAGGADAVAARAAEMSAAGEHEKALHMADVALEADRENRMALEAKLAALEALLAASANINERGWITTGIAETNGALDSL